MAINDEIGSTGSEMGTGGQKAVNAGRKTVNTAKKAVRGAKKIKKGYDLFKSGQLLKILLQKPGVWLSTIFGNLWWIMICFCLCLPLALINMGAEGITDSEAEGEAYEKMVNKVIRAFHNVPDDVGSIYTTADNMLQQYLNYYFPAKDKYKSEELGENGLTFPGADKELTANLTIGYDVPINPVPYYWDDESSAQQYAIYKEGIEAGANPDQLEENRHLFEDTMHAHTGVRREPGTVDFPDSITPEEAIAIKYIAIDSVCKQYYLGDDEINLNDFEAILDTFFDTMTTDVGWDSIQSLFNYVDYGSYDENGVWHEFSNPGVPGTTFDMQSVKNNMSIKETGKYLVYNNGQGLNGQGQTVDQYDASGEANIWQGSVQISVLIRERNNFLRDKRDDIIQTMMDEDGLTEDEAVEELGEMIDDMEQTIVSELNELHEQGVETNPDGSSDGGSDTPFGPSDGARCFPDLPNETRYNRFSDGYTQLFNVMRQNGFSLALNVIQCVDMAHYCVCIQQDGNMAYSWFSGNGVDIAAGLVNAHPDDYRLVSRSEVVSGSIISMPTDGYGTPNYYGHVVYVEEVYADGSMLITEGLPYNISDAYLMINRWVPSNYMSSQNVNAIAAPIN